MFLSGPSFVAGFATGFGTGFFTRELTKAGRGAVRPAVKTVVRGAFQAVDKLRESLAVAGETFEDLVAEVRAEMATPVLQTSAAEAQAAAVTSDESQEPTMSRAIKVKTAAAGNDTGEKSRAGKKG
jgi:hypothetical protein